MQKQLAFVITAVVLLAEIASVTLYTVHIANAQSNMASAGGTKNMTTGSNMTGATGNTTGGAHGSSIHTTNPAGLGSDQVVHLALIVLYIECIYSFDVNQLTR